jgi:SAM-dependent methyltransferase
MRPVTFKDIFQYRIPLTYYKFRVLYENYRLRITIKYAEWKEAREKENNNNSSDKIPPPSLRIKEHGDNDSQRFFEVGKRTVEDIENILQRHLRRSLLSFQNILDFGCGCGRNMIWLYRCTSKPNYYGTDIDEKAIEWCKNNLPFATFSVNTSFPPLPFMPDTFDLIIIISVFTHLDEEMQLAWIQELHRILKPKGIVLLSVHGLSICKNMPKVIRDTLEVNGFVFVNADFTKGIFPEWYKLSFHTEKYIKQKFDTYFKLLCYIEKGINDHHDAVLLEKRY